MRRRKVEFIVLWALSTIGAFTCIMTALVVAWVFYVMWREKQAPVGKPITYTQGAAYDACLDEPEPIKKPNYSAVHCLDQIDALLERLETS